MKNKYAWCWVFAAFLVASARLFETGLSLDPAIYAVLSRQFARTTTWWSFRAGDAFFPQFFEHPFLTFWIQGTLFKIFGVSDWSSRLYGLLCGSLSFYFLFRLGELLVDRFFANLVCFVTLLSVPFIGRVATLYLEIPLTFYALAAIYFGCRETRPCAVLAGVALACAFATKGLAALPALAVMGVMALYLRRYVNFVVAVVTTKAILAAFLSLQHHFGEYSFWNLYISTALFGKAIRPAMSIWDPLRFFWEYLKLHPLHLLIAFAAPYSAGLRKELRPAIWLGASGLLLFGLANGLLGKTYYHYFYPLFPFSNFLTAAALYPLLLRYATSPCHVWAIRIGIAYQVLWNLLPVPMRRKPWLEFYQLEGVVTALKSQGVTELDGLRLKDNLWIYPAMSLWYWDIDTRNVDDIAKLKSPAVLVENETASSADLQTLQFKGYFVCAGSPRYTIYVASVEKRDSCLRAGISAKWVR